jgi:IS30 family transposase
MKPASRRWTSDENTELDRLLDAGKEAAEIAVALNRTRQAIYARLQRIYRKDAGETKSGRLKVKE